MMAFMPALAAGLLVYKDGGAGAVRQFLRQSGDARKVKPWAWGVAVGMMPLVMVASAMWLIATGERLPAPDISPLKLVLLTTVFFVAATTEELGWSGYAARPLQQMHGALITAGILAVWAIVWHVVPLIQAGRTWDWIAWWALGTAARRIIILWLFLRGGQSVFATSLFHTSSNVSWMMFPVMGSHYDPQSIAVILGTIAVIIIGRCRIRQ